MFGLFDDLLDMVDDQSEFWTGRPLRGGSRPSTHTKRPDPNAQLRARVEALERAELERRRKAAEHAAAKAQEEAQAAPKARQAELAAAFWVLRAALLAEEERLRAAGNLAAADAKAREIEEADAAEIARLMALRGLEAMIAGEAAPKPKKED